MDGVTVFILCTLSDDALYYTISMENTLGIV